MKKLIHTFLVLGVGGVSLVSCGEKEDAGKPDRSPEEALAEAVSAPTSAPVDEPAIPAEKEVLERLLPELADFPAVRAEQVLMDASPAEDGSTVVIARVRVSVGENLYEREAAPEVFDVERRAMNDAMNRAMLPEAHYLLQVGAETQEITEEDRRLFPLPEELLKQANDIRALAEQPVYRLRTPAGTAQEIPATLRLRKQGSRWEIADLSVDTALLQPLVDYVPEAALPQDATVVNDGFEEARRAELRKLIAAFNEAAEPGIQAREDAARKRILEARARAEEEAKADAERMAQATAAREAWDKACADYVREGAVFEGEWKRGDHFGKFTLRLARVQGYTDSAQFTGTLSDSDLPQAELQVVGRVEPPSKPGDDSAMTVRLYTGRYDPNVPTAEVFDAKDGLLKLRMAADGVLSGVLTCGEWGEASDKAFQVKLAPVAKKPARRAR